MFEWQRHTQGDKSIPPYSELLSFLDLRAWASENVKQEPSKRVASGRDKSTPKSYTISTDDLCAACKARRHPLFACNVFQGLAHAKKLSVVRNNNICLNCWESAILLKNVPLRRNAKGAINYIIHGYIWTRIKERRPNHPRNRVKILQWYQPMYRSWTIFTKPFWWRVKSRLSIPMVWLPRPGHC